MRVGYTPGCCGCIDKKAGKRHFKHTEECRARILREMERLNQPTFQRLLEGERRCRKHACGEIGATPSSSDWQAGAGTLAPPMQQSPCHVVHQQTWGQQEQL